MKQSVKKKSNEVNTTFNDVLTYCDDVTSGKIIACDQIKKQVLRFQDDLKGDYYVDENLYNSCVDFFGIIKHYTGATAGEPFILLDWQKFVVQNIVALKHKETHLNKYKEQYLQLQRKQGKSFFVAALSLFYLTQTDEMQGEVIVCQNNTDQQQVIFTACERIQKNLDPNEEYFRYLRGKKISFEHLYATLKVIPQQSKFLDGLSTHFSCIDEFHQQTSSNAFDAIRSSTGFRQNPMICIVTTQGFNKDGPCYRKYLDCKDILNGVTKNDRLFAQIFEQDNIEEIDDPTQKTWIKSNPSLDKVTNRYDLEDAYNDYKMYQHKQVEVLTKRFNMWCDDFNEVFIADEYLINSMVEGIEFDKSKLMWCGIDLQPVNDLTQCAFLQKIGDEYIAKINYYYPKYSLKQNDTTAKIIEWERNGYIKFSDDNTTDYNMIVEDIKKYTANNFVLDGIIYDSYNSNQMIKDLTQLGYDCKQYSQRLGQFNSITKTLIRLHMSGKIKIEKNPVLLWNYRNVKLKRDEINDNIKPIKKQPQQKIDGVVQILMQIAGEQLSI